MHPAYSSRIPVLLAAGGIGGIVVIVAGIVIHRPEHRFRRRYGRQAGSGAQRSYA